MSANSPKDNPLASTAPCALYYFPEIPSGEKKEPAAASSQGYFQKGSFSRHENHLSSDADQQDLEAVRLLTQETFDKGREQGRAETVAAQQKEVDQAVAALAATVDALVRIRQGDIECMESETVRLALAIAKKIIGYEAAQGEVIGPVVRAAMEKVGDPRHLTVRLNPADVETVSAFKGDLKLDDDAGSVLRLETDETIKRGGCMIETKLGDVDARIDQQLRIIAEQLTDQLPKPSVDG